MRIFFVSNIYEIYKKKLRTAKIKIPTDKHLLDIKSFSGRIEWQLYFSISRMNIVIHRIAEIDAWTIYIVKEVTCFKIELFLDGALLK